MKECSVCQSTGKIKNRKYNQSKSNEYKEGREKFACRGKKIAPFDFGEIQ